MFKSLVTSYRHFIEDLRDDFFFYSPETQALSSSKQVEQKTLPPLPKIREKVETKPLVQSGAKDEMKSLIQKLHPSLFQETPLIISLVCDKEASLSFVKKVAHFIHTSYLPAAPFLCTTKKEFITLLQNPHLRLLIVPASLIEEYLSRKNNRVHEIQEMKKDLYLLPLESWDNYIRDLKFKHSLWNTLKTLPFEKWL